MSGSSQRPPPPPHSAVPPDHPLAQETAKLRDTLVFMERLAILAIHRQGGTMQIDDKEWATAQDADIQWRTLRKEETLQPVLHVAVTLQGEKINVTQSDINNLKGEQKEQADASIPEKTSESRH